MKTIIVRPKNALLNLLSLMAFCELPVLNIRDRWVHVKFIDDN